MILYFFCIDFWGKAESGLDPYVKTRESELQVVGSNTVNFVLVFL